MNTTLTPVDSKFLLLRPRLLDLSHSRHIKPKLIKYPLSVSCCYDVNGKHKEQSMTWRPEEGMSKHQIEKELNRQAVMFEESVNHGYRASAMKFQELAEEWFENYAKNALRSTTYERMLQLTHRVYPAIWHLRIDKITARHLQVFVNSLAREGANEKTGKPLAPKSIRHNLSFISDVFSYAVSAEARCLALNGKTSTLRTTSSAS